MHGGKAQFARVLSLAWLGALGACSEAPSEQHAARATSAVVISPPLLYNNIGPIPGNGGLLIWSQFSAEATVDVRPASAPETLIAGSLRGVGRYLVWTPDATMPPGTYTVQVGGSAHGESMDTIEVTAPRTFGRPVLTSSPTLTLSDQTDEYACCTQLVEQTSISTVCFGISLRKLMLLTPGISTMESASALTQLLFEVRARGEEPIYQADIFRGNLEPVYIDQQEDEYCFELIVTEIATGEQYTFDDLVHCVPHGDQPDFGKVALEPLDSDLDRLVCQVPPAGYEERWCDLNEAPCAAAPGSLGCEAAGHVCRGEPVPEPMTTGGSGGSAGTSGASGSAGASGMTGHDEDPIAGTGGAGEAGSNDEPSEPAKHVTACSAQPQRALSPWPLLALLGAALVLLVNRRS